MESGDSIPISCGEHIDTAHKIEMAMAQQLAGASETVSNSIDHEQDDAASESDGDW